MYAEYYSKTCNVKKTDFEIYKNVIIMEKDLSKLTQPQLQVQLRKLGLKVSGNKPDLILRIQDYESSISNYSKSKVPKLKALLKERKLSQTGRKVELVNRLEASDTKTRPVPQRREENSPPKRGLSKLPPELNIEIFLNLDDKSLARACRTNKEAAKICNDDLFWKSRIERIFDYDLSKYKGEKDATYRKMYKFLTKHNTSNDNANEFVVK